MNAEQKQRMIEIAERVRAASPGPWFAHRMVDEYGQHVNEWHIPETGAEAIFELPDAIFIAHARDDVPWLVELVRILSGAYAPIRDNGE